MVMVTIEPQLMDSEFKVLIDGVTKRVSASFYKKVCFSQLGSLTLFQYLAIFNYDVIILGLKTSFFLLISILEIEK